MTINYNVPGKKRKELAQTIAKWTGFELEYLGAPSFAYLIDCFLIDKDGTLSFDSGIGGETVQALLEHLHNEGYEFVDFSNDEMHSEPEEEPIEETNLVIRIPKTGFTETTIQNLRDLISSKSYLIKKSLGAKDLDIQVDEECINFPWFEETSDADKIKAYSHLVTALCKKAKKLSRVNKCESEVENEKYAFRCFLLRLGFIGSEYKTERKILLQNFTGSSAFKNGQKKEEA